MDNFSKDTSVKFRIWVFRDNEKLIGKGRIQLLELIRETGSITNAAKAMKMSYRQAWQMVKEINERAKEPIVEKKLGGKEGGGSIVTARGEYLINTFHELENNVKSFIEMEVKKYNL